MISVFLARGIILVFGTLFPAYYSYKAVKTKNVKEYVKWMMYWIVFAFFTCLETITDLFVAFWFPFYYELKILLVLWLLSPATRGSSVLYRKFVHPFLTQREEDIDECIIRAKQQGYSTVLQLGTKGVNYATSFILQTAIKGGGGFVNQLKRSYSVGELAEDQMDARTGGDHNSNVKVLPPGHVMGDYRHQPPTHAERGVTGISRSTSSASVSHSSRRVPGSSSPATRSSKALSVDAADLYHSTHDLSLSSSTDDMGGSNMSSSVPVPGPSATVRRRSPRIQQDGRCPPTPPSHEAPASQLPRGPARRRGRSETGRPRPKSMINTGEVREAYQWGAGKEQQRPRLNTHSGGRTASIAKPVSRPPRAAATTIAISDVASHDDAMMMDLDATTSDGD